MRSSDLLKQVSEDIVFRMIRWRILDIRKQELYTYSMEVILLNGSIFLSMLGISLLTKTLVHFIFFIAIFCPIRMLAGGYHAKTVGQCFLLSNGIFIISILIRYLLLNFKWESAWVMLGLFFILRMFITGPIERKEINVSEKIYSRHKKRVNVLLLICFILLFVMYVLQSRYLNSVVLAIIFAGILQEIKGRV